MVDNLMDLTHETYVHATSIGQKEIDEVPCKTELQGENMVVTSRFMENISAPPFWAAALRSNNLADDVPVDRWQIRRFTPPSHVMIEVGWPMWAMVVTTRPPNTRSTAWWWTSSPPRRTPPSTISGAWRASSTRRTRR